MNRIKTTSLAIAMALALAALLGVASASASQFRAEEYPTTLNGTAGTKHKLTTAAGGLNCSIVNTTGTLSAASSTVTFTPEFNNCFYQGLKTTPKVNSCKYVFHSTSETAPYTGTMDIACSKEGDAIEFPAIGAPHFLKIPAQTGLAVELANTGTRSRNRTITVTLNATGVKYTGTYQDAGWHEDGVMTGSSILKGYNGAAEHAVGTYVANQQVESLPLFEGEQYSAVVDTGVKSVKLGLPAVGAGNFTCTSFNANGKFDAPGSLALSILQWNGCYFGVGFNINKNHCGLTLNPTVSEKPFAWSSLDITCPTGSELTFAIPFCQVSIPPQTNRNSVKFENIGSGTSRDIKMTFQISNLKYKATGCNTPGTYEDGTLFGEFTLDGYQNMGSEIIEGSYLRYKTLTSQGIWVE